MSTARGFLIAALFVSACGPSRETRDLCQRAANKYTTCIGEILDPDAVAMARAKEKDGIQQCAGDDKTVEMYRTCLPKTSCDDFMQCMEDYAAATVPR